MKDENVSDSNTLINEVEINLNMLGVLMLDEVGGEIDRADVIALDQSGQRHGVVQLPQ
jgi:hypothetical protein